MTQGPCPLDHEQPAHFDSKRPPSSAQISGKASASLVDVLQPGRFDSKPLPSSAQSSEKSPASLVAVLQKHKNALKSPATVSSFHQWLQSVDIENLDDFYDALADDEVFEEMKQNGLKAFKRSAILREVEAQRKELEPNSFSTPHGAEKIAASSNIIMPYPQPPAELVCPITHALFRDPVIAADNQTYERVEIEAWFHKTLSAGTFTPLSPLTGEPLEHLNLSPNILIAKLACDFVLNHPGFDF